ncbi:MAG: tRNA lysidine(34) synthetase TilS [Gemmatimonadota bacterium]
MNSTDTTAGTSVRPLEARLDAHLQSSGLLATGDAVTVALSGGIDSVVLLHLLVGLREDWGWTLSAAHFDHGMREESQADAVWVSRLCSQLDVPLHSGRAASRPAGETEAREVRYDFLQRARAELGGDWLATAHQADDQAETVLFRLLRGTGVAGAAGIPARRAPHVVRPLLPFWRAELQAYARERGIEYLLDPTNLDLSLARNRIRHWLIPELEAGEAPDLRGQLKRLAGLSARAAAAAERCMERGLERLVRESTESRVVVARSGLLAYDTSARAHLLRHLVARVGPRPGRAGTLTALEFITTGSSGRRIALAGGIEIRREFDRLIVERARTAGGDSDAECEIKHVGAGRGVATIGGASWSVGWAPETGAEEGVEGVAGEEIASFAVEDVRFPLSVRSWRHGDRMVLPAGTRKLKKVFVDRRIGRSERSLVPLVADRAGVLWIVGVVRGARAAPRRRGEALTIRIKRES